MVTQEIPLKTGWNAIYIDVEPLEPLPGQVFTNSPVTKAATYLPSESPVEFIQDPSSEPWKLKGWRIWYAPRMAEAAISDLQAVRGAQGYLVFASAEGTLRVRGEILHRLRKWRSDSFNLVGFNVDPPSPPTFSAWFAGATAHASDTRSAVYRLDVSGVWRPVNQADTTLVDPGAAYWVFCKGGSDHQGPLAVRIAAGGSSGRLDFGVANTSMTLKVSNVTPNPVRFALALSDPSAPILRQTLDASSNIVRSAIPGGPPSETLEAGASVDVRLVLDRARLTLADYVTVLTVTDDVGSRIRIPVTAQIP